MYILYLLESKLWIGCGPLNHSPGMRLGTEQLADNVRIRDTKFVLS